DDPAADDVLLWRAPDSVPRRPRRVLVVDDYRDAADRRRDRVASCFSCRWTGLRRKARAHTDCMRHAGCCMFRIVDPGVLHARDAVSSVRFASLCACDHVR
ncbi:hypothetical protein QM306_37085, partial [Burkholderia cenocepacia]|nr:hypothetical protein [Burkholderia cenocepacia]